MKLGESAVQKMAFLQHKIVALSQQSDTKQPCVMHEAPATGYCQQFGVKWTIEVKLH